MSGTSVGSVSAGDEAKTSILVAEDDRDQSEMLCEMLRDQGYDVHAAYTGPEALCLARTLVPALLILDLQLPERSGLQVLEDLRERSETHRIPVVVVSTYASYRVDGRLRALDVKAELPKPVDRQELLEVVRRAVGRA